MSVLPWTANKARSAGTAVLNKAVRGLKTKLAVTTVRVTQSEASSRTKGAAPVDFAAVIQARLDTGRCPIQVNEHRWCSKKRARIYRNGGLGLTCGSEEHALVMNDLIEAGLFDPKAPTEDKAKPGK
jgi:hypothetical protein